jgi:uncharacterized OB-fold protein
MALENKISEVAENEFYSPAYHRAVSEKRLIGAKCHACGVVTVPPKAVCPECRTGEVGLIHLKGTGRLAAYTVIYVPPPMMVEEGFNPKNPYCSGIVELEEGPKITARILGVDLTRPDQIPVGIPVRAEYVEAEHAGVKRTYLAFKALP